MKMTSEPESATLLANIHRSILLLIKLKLTESQDSKTQKEMILFLGDLGCTVGEIVDLLDIPKTSVGPTLSRAKVKNRGK